MKIVFLGTNGWYTTSTGNTPSVLVDSKDHYVVFDAGNGIYKLDQYIKEEKSPLDSSSKPISLFISHFHIDHVSGFHSFNKFKFPQIIDIYMAKGRKKDFDILVNPPFTSPKPSTQISINELSEGIHKLPFPVEVIEQFHAYRNHGYRVTLEGKVIAYSGDCGISDASIKLAKGANVLIHECAFKSDHPPTPWGHVGPTEAANLAKEAGVKKLILNHFDPTQYPTLEDRKKAEQQAQAIFPNTIVATDDLVITL